jgi:hypothetical protein
MKQLEAKSLAMQDDSHDVHDIISKLDEPWQRKERLRYIDTKLFWTGSIRRDDICQAFGIHTTNASKDIQTYVQSAGKNLVYDRRDKIYRATSNFVSISRVHQVSNLLAYTNLNIPWHGFISNFLLSVDLPVRQPEAVTTRTILLSIHQQSGIEVTYRSMNNPNGLKRVIFPKVVIFDGLRWHTRAYDQKTGEYRDFVLSRISSCGMPIPAEQLPEDKDWQKIVKLEIRAHPSLNADQVKMIEYDYQMQNGTLELETRKPLSRYIIRTLNLDTDLEPPRQNIECINLDELDF